MTTTSCVGLGYNVYKVKLYSSNIAMATHRLIVIIMYNHDNWPRTTETTLGSHIYGTQTYL